MSFLAKPDSAGLMVKALGDRGLAEKVSQFKFDPRRPDLSKLSALLARIDLVLDDLPPAPPADQDATFVVPCLEGGIAALVICSN